MHFNDEPTKLSTLCTFVLFYGLHICVHCVYMERFHLCTQIFTDMKSPIYLFYGLHSLLCVYICIFFFLCTRMFENEISHLPF